jgi:hypothetical protein
MIGVLTMFVALIVAEGQSGWLPRVVVLVAAVLAWTVLLTLKLRPLSRYLRDKLRAAFADALRTRRFRLLFGGLAVHQAATLVVLLYPANGSGVPELVATLAMIGLFVALAVGRNLRSPQR